MNSIGLNLMGTERPYAYALDQLEYAVRQLVKTLGPPPEGALDKLRQVAFESATTGMPLWVTKEDDEGFLIDEPLEPTGRDEWEVPEGADWPQAARVLTGGLIEAACRDQEYDFANHQHGGRLMVACYEASQTKTPAVQAGASRAII